MTDARESILAAVRAARPAAVAAPDVRAVAGTFTRPDVDPVAQFAEVARAADAVVTITSPDDRADAIRSASAHAARTLSCVRELAGTVGIPRDVHDLSDLDLLVAGGTLGVAECGAIWVVPEGNAARAALFLAERVVLVLDGGTIVHDLHEAYERIDIATVPFGVFIAGPSKTADIEQSLVVGAHGPKSLTVVIVSPEP